MNFDKKYTNFGIENILIQQKSFIHMLGHTDLANLATDHIFT